MLKEKRIRKTTTPFISTHMATQKKKSKPIEKKRKLNTCDYQLFPVPPKLMCANNTILLYGNIPLVQKDGEFFTDFSLLNESHIYGNIKVSHSYKQKMLNISAERRSDMSFPRWKTIEKKINQDKIANIRIWSRTIRKYSESYENMMNKLFETPRKTLISEQKPETLSQICGRNKAKKDTLLNKFPCILIRTQFRGSENRLSELIVNEMFLQMIGYTPEIFISTVLAEGFPLITPFNTRFNSDCIKNVLDYFAVQVSLDYSTPEFETQILTKSGFVKSAKVQVHFLAHFEEGRYGSDTLFTFVDKDPLFLLSKNSYEQELNKEFIDMMIKREKEMQDFLSCYYNLSLSLTYLNIQRVCAMRELMGEESVYAKEEPFEGSYLDELVSSDEKIEDES